MSLKSENLLVRIFAILDRRVGKRRLTSIRRTLEKDTSISDVFKEFFAIRIKAEGMRSEKNFE